MYYDEHRAVAEEEITSHNFCCLVDAAVMLYDEEKEERDKRIFQLILRKPRTPVKKSVPRRTNPLQLPSSSRNPLQRPSSSSSLLFDLNKIPPDDSEMSPNAFPSSLGVNMIAAADDSEMKNPQNPSCSSSSSLRNYMIVAEPNDSEMRIPRNPNYQPSLSSCITEKPNRKRRAVQGNGGKSKKPKVDDAYSWIGKKTPESLIQLMRDTSESVTKWGARSGLKLIFQRKLFKTDVNPSESRLSMPYNELICKDFLTLAELRIIREDINNPKIKRGVGAILVDEKNVKHGVMLKRWETKNGSWNYALTCGWNDVVEANGLKLDDNISIWCFRWGGLLCFALVTRPPME
ncbi:unnamed protein product [Microthlaspi erraticum]|uniref:TF-B3 domain-containing protein n=1 Tax=Microthlaspi erraticum TaxID=1685480 RepID=A0A6D2IDV6_9BRAS|nr:unnamed protein product [Microthlaspi erraticum]